MDTLMRYAESDGMKDAGLDEDKTGKGKKSDGAKGYYQNPGHDGNQGGQGKRWQHDGGSDLVANTNTSFRNHHWNTLQRRKLHNYEEMLKAPCPHHSTPDTPSTHSWEDCYVM